MHPIRRIKTKTFLTSICLLAPFILGLSPALADKPADKPVKVFILAGQSNMVGHGKAEEGGNPKYDPKGSKGKDNPREIPAGLGSLRAMVNDNPEKFGPHGKTPLVGDDGKWLVRKDVKIYAYCDGKTKKDNLSVGFAAPGASTWIGPEFGFGHAVGNTLSEDVLIIKISTGGTSLAKNWRSPGAVAKRGGEVGPQYAHMVKTATEVLADLGKEFPEFAGRKSEIAGFGWHQGWNDGCDKVMAPEYEANMADFIQDVRKEFSPTMAFVIANSGFGGDNQAGSMLVVREAQDAMANTEKYPLFKGNVAVVNTRAMWRDEKVSPSAFGYHWNHNGITHYLIGEGMGEATVKLLRGGAELSQEAFRTPPIQARPSAFWSWLNGNVDRKQITRELEEMKAKGMRGGIVWDVGALSNPDKIIPAGPQFLGPESLESIHHTMDEAQRLGLELGIFASSSWNAGGTWITPEDGSKSLLFSEQKVDGPSEFSGILPLPKKVSEHHQDVAVWAVPESTDKSIAAPDTPIRLDSHLADDGKLTWSVPAGSWRILRFIQNNTGEFLNCPSPNSKGLVIDHLSRQATDAHMNHMLDTISRGRNGFGPIKIFELDSYEVHSATDWTPDFIKAFIARNQYDPTPWLPVFAGWTVGGKESSERFLHDYHKMVSDLIIENHFARAKELLNKRGLQLLAEGGHGGSARVDPLKALGAADIPMGEFWNNSKNWVTKEAASAAHIYGKQLVNSESFTGWQNWQDGPAAYKRLLDVAFCAGLNQVTFHTFAHNPPEAGLPGYAYHAGEHFNVNSTWWDQAGPMIEDMSRCSHLLQQGLFVADVCAYYGDNAPNLVPARRIAPTVKSQWSDDKCAHCGRPKPVNLDSLGHSYDYDYINEEVILNRMKFDDGKFVLPDGMSYRVMLLPDRETISPAVLKQLGGFVKAGATIVGPKPERSNSLKGYPECDREVRELAARIWGDCDGAKVRSHSYGKGRVRWNVPLADVLAELNVAPDFLVENQQNPNREIDYIHRQTKTEDIYFVANTTMSHQSVLCRFRVAAGRVPGFWNAENGSVKPCHVFETGDGFVRVPIDLPPASSIFVVFSQGARPDHLVSLDGGNAVEALAVDGNNITVKAHKAGAYAYRTAKGRSGSITVNEVPADLVLEGPWKVTFPPDRGAPAEATFDSLTDWTASTDPGIRYFSGTATYYQTFTLPKMPAGGEIMLDLTNVREVATVKVNGKEAGVLWKHPWRANIGTLLKEGENQLEIAVTNVWNNRIVGDLQPGVTKPVTRTNIKAKFNVNTPLRPSGLIGPVKLAFPVTVSVKLP